MVGFAQVLLDGASSRHDDQAGVPSFRDALFPLAKRRIKSENSHMALVGIARLAAQSQVLETKRPVRDFEIPARSILNRTKPNMPFQWTINPYRGCEFGGKYGYARYTHVCMETRPECCEAR